MTEYFSEEKGHGYVTIHRFVCKKTQGYCKGHQTGIVRNYTLNDKDRIGTDRAHVPQNRGPRIRRRSGVGNGFLRPIHW